MPSKLPTEILAALTISPTTTPPPDAAKASKPDGPKRSDPFQFGSRFLEEGDDPMAFNAWDHVDVDDEYMQFAYSQLEKQREKPVTEFDKQRFMSNPAKWWDAFYKNNQENFFKDRKWLAQEFPILASLTSSTSAPARIVELGCGAGNTMFPILSQNQNPEFHIHGCDYSAQAISIVKSQPLYLKHNLKGTVAASVYDLSEPNTLPEGIEEGSVDAVLMVFVFSALAPEQWGPAVDNVKRMLKPGGKVLLRDYGRHDLAQVRFKSARYLEENFYVRGDGTRVYFFEEEELERIFTGKEKVEKGPDAERDGSENSKGEDSSQKEEETPESGSLVVKHMAMDKRMLVNRKRQIKMYRRWVQAVFEKTP
ncbi:methyltransferase [Ascodesmis nigricans]|uniref:tRNA N(3)-methylcytidine methyltransferase n=1 Tax=Ascodesmis nigricans TaxID=341454 RepID=A0A4S2MS63_9PEZI|nr:methyltransferase [Ascodesmis nigricans]